MHNSCLNMNCVSCSIQSNQLKQQVPEMALNEKKHVLYKTTFKISRTVPTLRILAIRDHKSDMVLLHFKGQPRMRWIIYLFIIKGFSG